LLLQIVFQVTQSPVISLSKQLGVYQTASPFDRRVTALEWHPTRPNVLCVGSKGGDIMLMDTECLDNHKMILGVGDIDYNSECVMHIL